jgi:hypothetical protein
LSTPPALNFVKVFFKIGSHGTICPGWLWATILPISLPPE